MRYSLAIYNSEKDYIEVNDFNKTQDFTFLNPNKLKDILTFTSSFNNELELKSYLYYNQIISDMNGKLAINFYNRDKVTKLNYGITYAKDIKKLDISYITDYFIAHYCEYDFIELFLQKYENYLKNVSTLSSYIYQIRLFQDNYKVTLSETIDAIRNFIFVYCTQKGKNGYVANIRNVRELAMFIKAYEDNKNRQSDNNIINSDPNYDDAIFHYEELIRNEEMPDDDSKIYEREIRRIKRLKGE